MAGSAARTLLRNGFAREAKQAYETSGQIASEAVQAIRTVASLCREPTFLAIYSQRVEQASTKSKVSEMLSAVAFAFADFFNYPTWALAFYMAGRFVSSGEFTFQDIMQALMSIIFGLVSVGRLATMAPSVANASVAAEDIYEIIDRVPAIDTLAEGGEVPDKFVGEIEFKGVAFSYPLRPTVTVMNRADLTFPAGATVALVGQSGCGKSTVIQLLERFYDPREGVVLVDGRDIRTLNPHWLRRQLGLVQQEPILLSRSLLDNIRYGKPDASIDEVQEAARAANIHEFIASLPDQYDTFVGERGTQLSGGQKQRVAIARALIRKPKVLLLDEATSALDSESEKIVQEALDRARAGRTCIAIGASPCRERGRGGWGARQGGGANTLLGALA